MGVNFNPDFSKQQINPLILNPQQQGPSSPASIDPSLSLNGSILTPENVNKSEQNTPAPKYEAIEIPMDEFLAEMNLLSLSADNIESATMNSMPNDVLQLIDNKAISSINITYTPAEDGSIVTEHYSQGDPPQLLAKTTQLGDSITSVAYNQDGLATKTSTIEDGVTTTQTFDDTGQRVTQEIVVSDGKSVTTNFDINGNSLGSVEVKGAVTSEFSPDGALTKKTVDKGNGLVYESTYSQNENGETIETTKNPIGDVAVTTKNTQGKSLQQTVTTQNGQTHSVQYDGNGNTKITVQNGETLAQIAQKFDCSVDDLKSMNKTFGDGNQAYFQVGQEIIVPGEIAADDARLTKRDSKDVAQAKFTATQIEIEAKKQEVEAQNQEIQNGSETDNSQKIQNKQEKLAEGKKLANALFRDMDGLGTSPEIAEHMSKINSDNVLETLNAYKKRSGGEGLATAITSDMFAIDLSNENPLNTISSALSERAQSAGVNADAIRRFEANFENARTGFVDKAEMEKSIDIILGEIAAKETSAGEIDSETAIQTIANNWDANVTTATEIFNEARELDTNIGKATDTVLGLFGCTTIDDMAEKLDLDASMAKKLTTASQSGDIESFKSVYKEIFHRDFDPQLVASYDHSTSQYILARQYSNLETSVGQMINDYEQALIRESGTKNHSVVPDFLATMPSSSQEASNIQQKLQSQLGINAEQYNALLESNGGDVKTLLLNLKDSYKNMQNEVTGGKSLTQLSQDISNMESAIFGGNDTIAEVAKFNKNQMITDIAGNVVVDVAIGAALSFVPGGATIVGPKLAASATKFSNLAMKAPKAVKLYNNISKTYNSSKTMKNIGKASKTFAETVSKDVTREEFLGFVHGEDKDTTKLFEKSATNTSIKMGVKFLAKSLGVNSKLIESCVTSALQVGAGTTTPEMAFFKTALGTTKLSPEQQRILAKHLNINFERFIENA